MREKPYFKTLIHVFSNPKNLLIWAASTTLIVLLFGIPTALIQTPFIPYVRMIPVTMVDYLFLLTNSILLGAYITLHFSLKQGSGKCNYAAVGGGTTSFLAVSCPICNVILVSLFGATALLTYFEPFRAELGFMAVVILVIAIIFKVKSSNTGGGKL